MTLSAAWIVAGVAFFGMLLNVGAIGFAWGNLAARMDSLKESLDSIHADTKARLDSHGERLRALEMARHHKED